MAADAELLARARDWLAHDPDPRTVAELTALLAEVSEGDAEAAADLADRFAGELDFGTAGLRGALGAGTNRMNVAVVIRAAAGVAAWLTSADGPERAAERGVVVCFDARHRSSDFAEVSAQVLAAAGIRVQVLLGPLPTPVLAFAVTELGAAAGIMVTASHNPPTDNGYKVYDGSGRQIVAPVDAAIASGIEAAGPADRVPRTASDDPAIERIGDELVATYVERAAAVRVTEGPVPISIAYTALHGVGTTTLQRVMMRAGFPVPVDTTAQAAPDPDFSTVPFPNPEKPGALDLGLANARAIGADVLLANDPDADRLGVAVPDATVDGGWRVLRGDEIGAILAHHLLRHDGIAADAVMATTIVSSTLLSRMAAAAGRPFVETLTGFKWLGRAADPDGTLGFAYEEALGFCVGGLVRDKDGITAAVVFAEAVATLAAEGRTVLDVLDELAVAHGVHATRQWSARVSGAEPMAQLTAAMERLRAAPPSELAGRTVTEVVDLVDGDPDRGLPASDVLILWMDGARIVVRPSGTEPKLKCYVEVIEPVSDPADLEAARSRADEALDALTAAIAATTGLG